MYLLLLYNKKYKVEFGIQLFRHYPSLVAAAGRDRRRFRAHRQEDAEQAADQRAEIVSNILDRITVQVLHSAVCLPGYDLLCVRVCCVV